MSTKTSKNEQAESVVFFAVGFDKSLREAFNRICVFIASAEGCNAGIYKPPHMKQMRAAHVLPGEVVGRKRIELFL